MSWNPICLEKLFILKIQFEYNFFNLFSKLIIKDYVILQDTFTMVRKCTAFGCRGNYKGEP